MIQGTKLNTSKLVKKVIVDKTGKKVTHWVKPGDIQKPEKGKKQEEAPQVGHKAMEAFASNTHTSKLKEFIKKPDSDEDLVRIAEKELQKRGDSDDKEAQGAEKPEASKEAGQKKVQDKKASKIVEKKEPNWYDELMSKHKLDRLPVGLEQKDVLVDESNPDSSWIMRWKDPKTGKTQFAYTREFLQKNAEDKWKRIQNIKTSDIDKVKKKTLALLDNEDDSLAQAAAIIFIMANTGLRVGARELFKRTGNRGVSTLSADSVEIEGNKISFNFIGKSYKENKSEIVEKRLAEYLAKLKKGKKGDDFLFNSSRDNLVEMFRDKMGFKDKKLKDLRTFVATQKAKEILYKDPLLPPPLPNKGVQSAIQKKLKHVFEVVSQKLNNTPAMAKSAYVHPAVIEQWLDDLGVSKEEISKGEQVEKLVEPSLEDITYNPGSVKNSPWDGGDYDEDMLDDDEVEDRYPLPDIMDDAEEEKLSKAELIDIIKRNIQQTVPSKPLKVTIAEKRVLEHIYSTGSTNLIIGLGRDFKEGMLESLRRRGLLDEFDQVTKEGEVFCKAILDGKAKGMNLLDIAKKHKVPLKQIVKEFKAGVVIEMEHTKSKKAAGTIAKDHLEEIPDYYKRLIRMEKEAKRS